MIWKPIGPMLLRKLSARDKNVCPDCGSPLERCKAWDISEDYIGQPEWAQAATNAKKCPAEGCGFYYMRVGPGELFMKPFDGESE